MDGSIVISTELDTKSFDRQIEKLEDELEGLLAEYEILSNDSSWSTQSKEAIDLREQIEKVNNRLIIMKGKQESIKNDMLGINESEEKSNANMSRVVGKVARWGMAIFGIRSIYGLIMSSANQLAQNNDQLANQLTAIKGSLANAIAPVVEVLVNLVYKLLSYLNVITKSFFGIDLFKKSAKSVGKTNAGAKALKKTIAGFDEMNILNAPASGGGGGGGGGTTPKQPKPIDTKGFKNIIDKYKKMWKDVQNINRTEMKNMLLSQDTTFGLIKLGWFDLVQGITFIVSGFVDTIKGLFQILKGVALGDTKTIKEGVTKLFEGIAKFLRGVVQTILSYAEIVGGVIIGLPMKLGSKVGELMKKVKDTVINFLTTLGSKFGNVWREAWNGLLTGGKKAFEGIKTVFSKLGTFFKDTFSKAWASVKSLFSSGGKIFNGMKEGIVEAFKKIVNAIINGINTAIRIPFDKANALLNKIHDVDILGVKPFKSLWERNPIKVPQIPKLAKGGIINMPGRGVPVGGAIAGEAGREAVLPLQDSQVLSEIADAIGRRITINANITNNMNGRVISRELQKIQSENNFAGNR